MISIEENLGAPRTLSRVPPPIKGCMGRLADQSPLREIFPDGFLPLRAPVPQLAQFPDAQLMVYLLDVARLTTKQFNAVALQVHRINGGSLNEILRDIVNEMAVPLALHHVEFVVMSLALFT